MSVAAQLRCLGDIRRAGSNRSLACDIHLHLLQTPKKSADPPVADKVHTNNEPLPLATSSPPQDSDKVAPAASTDQQRPVGLLHIDPRMEKLLEQRAKWEADRRIFYDWLGQAPEEPLEPELEIVDTHHHL